jgi:hypothetical protein
MKYLSHGGMMIVATCLPDRQGFHPVSFVTGQVMTFEKQIINR